MAERVLRLRIKRFDPTKYTLTVELDMRQIRARLALGIWLIRLGAYVIGFGVKIKEMKL